MAESTPDPVNIIRIFSKRANGATAILGPGIPNPFALPVSAAHNVDLMHLALGDVELAAEGLQFGGEVKLKAVIKDPSGLQICFDWIQLKASPLILIDHLRPVEISYVSRTSQSDAGAYCAAFIGATPAGISDHVIPPDLNGGLGVFVDPFPQDQFQMGYQDAPYGRMHVVLDSKRNRPLKVFPPRSDSLTPPGLLGSNLGYLKIDDGTSGNNCDSFGNLEISPPCAVGGTSYPFGRIYYGTKGSEQMDAKLREFISRQVQPPVSLGG